MYRQAAKGLEILMHQTGENQAQLPALNKTTAELQHLLDTSGSDSPGNAIHVHGGRVIAVELEYTQGIDGVGGTQPLKEHLENMLSSHGSSKFMAFKELFRSVLPNEYALLKEFKDILLDRNSVRDL
jgi:hypothetical protein